MLEGEEAALETIAPGRFGDGVRLIFGESVGKRSILKRVIAAQNDRLASKPALSTKFVSSGDILRSCAWRTTSRKRG